MKMSENSPLVQPPSTNSSAARHGSDAFRQKARRYYEKINAGEIDEEYFALFAEDVEVFYPKFGIARGREAIAELGRRVQSIVSDFAFDLDQFVYTCQTNRVAVEIVEHGALKNGKIFPDGKASFGKFCNVFEFNTHGQIARYHCYGDPDYAAEDAARVAIFARG
ncbi:nuclear transport factor 2 family protein [Vandammella animalimorsus]|uniref:nuclear transport factor 2 family protein n=1 Tax=Vandammella animalimorsus TaxID=2029117 RepID=UPI0015517B74|nr:nuclear transport factor 2 family protein [Vandammella animalimorsus]